MSNDRLARALAAIDQANQQDPNMERVGDHQMPRELVYGERMTGWLMRLRAEPTEAQQLAARGQHIRRWQVPRSDYPKTREGYLRWRTYLYRFHENEMAGILNACGYDECTIEQVKQMVGKRGIKRDPDVQLIEDVACLVFLEFNLASFAVKQPAEKLPDIIRMTWGKMSETARAAALTILYSDDINAVLMSALSSEVAV